VKEKNMPIIKQKDFGTDRVPSWVKISGGINAMGCSTRDKSSPPVELHYHDAEEFWFVLKGKAKVMTEGKEYVVEPGDIVCTHKGDEHAILEIVEEPYTQVWVECNLRGEKRSGHLHR
jgi:mannose-6-phosphate isomerase-like protein (cupin superfamily)